jgi:hypothetical protein
MELDSSIVDADFWGSAKMEAEEFRRFGFGTFLNASLIWALQAKWNDINKSRINKANNLRNIWEKLQLPNIVLILFR